MIKTCPTHQLQWNDATVKACPLCAAYLPMKTVSAKVKPSPACQCKECVGRRTKETPARQKVTHAKRTMMVQEFVAMYDKEPTGYDLEQFKGFYKLKHMTARQEE